MATVGIPLAEAAVTAAVSYAMAPSQPKPPKAPLMPDQKTVLQQQRLREAQAAAERQGRASTILSTNASTGDRLGP